MSNKGSDIDVGSIEKISQTSDKNVANVEELIQEYKTYNDLDGIQDLRPYIEALENLLAEREQKDKRIQELEEERQLVGIPVRNKRDGKIGIVLHQWENGSIAVLERINPRIINTHDSWNTLEIITDEVKQVQTQDDTISKQVVIDKIKELKKRKNKYEYETQEIFANAYYDRKRLEIIHKIDILQELLGTK